MAYTDIISGFMIQVIDDAGSLDAMAEALRELDRRFPPETVYQSAEFLVPWLAYAAKRTRLHTMLIWKNTQIRAALPLVSDEVKRGPISIPRLGLPTQGVHPPSFDFRYAEKDAAPAAEALLSMFARSGAPWKVLSLRHLAGNSALLQVLPGLCRKRGLSFSWYPCRREGYLVLDGSWASYLARLRKKHRSEVNRGFRSVQEARGWEFVHEWPGEDGVAEALERYIRVIRGSWKSDEADDEALVALLEDVLRSFARSGDLLVSRLNGPGVDGAVIIQLRQGTRLTGFQMAYMEDCPIRGPGTLLLGSAISYAYETGAGVYDFSTYAEHIHRWSPLYRNTANVYITKKTPTGWLIQRQMAKRDSKLGAQ